jgi:hypothetical protein
MNEWNGENGVTCTHCSISRVIFVSFPKLEDEDEVEYK